MNKPNLYLWESISRRSSAMASFKSLFGSIPLGVGLFVKVLSLLTNSTWTSSSWYVSVKTYSFNCKEKSIDFLFIRGCFFLFHLYLYRMRNRIDFLLHGKKKKRPHTWRSFTLYDWWPAWWTLSCKCMVKLKAMRVYGLLALATHYRPFFQGLEHSTFFVQHRGIQKRNGWTSIHAEGTQVSRNGKQKLSVNLSS